MGEPLTLGVAQVLQKDYQLLQLPHQFPAQCHSLLVLLKVQKGQTQMLVQKLVYWKLHHYLGAQSYQKEESLIFPHVLEG